MLYYNVVLKDFINSCNEYDLESPFFEVAVNNFITKLPVLGEISPPDYNDCDSLVSRLDRVKTINKDKAVIEINNIRYDSFYKRIIADIDTIGMMSNIVDSVLSTDANGRFKLRGLVSNFIHSKKQLLEIVTFDFNNAVMS
jgi:hypothetical protein